MNRRELLKATIIVPLAAILPLEETFSYTVDFATGKDVTGITKIWADGRMIYSGRILYSDAQTRAYDTTISDITWVLNNGYS